MFWDQNCAGQPGASGLTQKGGGSPWAGGWQGYAGGCLSCTKGVAEMLLEIRKNVNAA